MNLARYWRKELDLKRGIALFKGKRRLRLGGEED